MTTHRPTPDPGRGVDPVGLVAGVLLPVAVLGAVVAWAWLNWDALPDEYPAHWDADGLPTRRESLTDSLSVQLMIPFFVVLPMTAAAAFARLERGLRAILLVIGLGTLGLLVGSTMVPLEQALRGLEEPMMTGPVPAIGVVAGLLVGVMGARFLVDSRPREAAESPVAVSTHDREYDLRLPAGWRYASLAVIVVPTVLVMVFSFWMGLAVGLLLLAVLAVFAPIRVALGPGGATATLLRLELLRIEGWEVESVEHEEIDPWRYGGIGLRLHSGGIVLAMGKGPGLRIGTAAGRTYRIQTPGESL